MHTSAKKSPTLGKSLDYITALQHRLWSKHGAERSFITAHELKRVLRLIEPLDLQVLLHNACMGFGIGISFCIDKSRVLTITQHHLGIQIGFDDAWPLFLQIAKQFEHRLIEPIKAKSHYEY